MPLGQLTPELSVKNLSNSLKFYVENCGWTILYDRSKFAYLELEGSHLMLEELGADRAWIAGAMEYPFGRGVNFQIGVADVVTLYKKLTDKGYKFFLELEEKWYRKTDFEVGNHQFIIQDPDGYLLRFAQDLGSRPYNPKQMPL